MKIVDNDLLSIQEARILIENSRESQKILKEFSQEKIDKILKLMIERFEENIEKLAQISYEETQCGKIEDKIIKNFFISRYLKEKIKEMKCVGIINENRRKKIVEIGVPLGVIAAFCPNTSPVSTTFYKVIIAIKSGNSIVFSLNRKAKKSMKSILDILIKSGEDSGLPSGVISYLNNTSVLGDKELIRSKDCSLIFNTCFPEILEEVYATGKPLIYSDTGGGPVFIERTSNIKKAVEDIVLSKAFDNGVMPGSEQYVVVDGPIALKVEKEFIEKGSYFMSLEEANLLAKVLFDKLGNFKREFSGKTPQELSKIAGFNINENIKLLISREKYVSLDNPYSREKICPVLSYYVEENWREACEKCIELLLEEGKGHTLIIHSLDEDVIKQFSLKKPVGRVLVNTSGSFGSIGGTTNLFPSLSLGSGVRGLGISSENVSPLNLMYIRKIGYESKTRESFFYEFKQKIDIYLLRNFLKNFLKKIDRE